MVDKIIGAIIVAFGVVITFLIAIVVWALRFGVIAAALYVLYLVGKSLFGG